MDARELFIKTYEDMIVKNWITECKKDGYLHFDKADSNVRRLARVTAITMWDLHLATE